MCIVLIENLTGNLSIVAVTYKASWMRTFGNGVYWERAMLVVARGEDLMLRRRRASESWGHIEEPGNVQYGLRVANAPNHDQNLQMLCRPFCGAFSPSTTHARKHLQR